MLKIDGSLHFQVSLDVATIEAHGSFSYLTRTEVNGKYTSRDRFQIFRWLS